jgi:hypothetical protein
MEYDYYRNVAYPCSISGYQTFNTDPSTPAAYLTGIVNWVHARLADT